MKDPVLPPFALLMCILVWLPFRFHWRLRNYSVMIMILWLSIGSFLLGLNALIWWSDTTPRGDPWCDISTRLMLMSQIGAAGCNFLLSRKLAGISSISRATRMESDRRREAALDIGLGFGIPIVHILLAILYQGHRYDLYEGSGCEGTTYQSWPYILFGLLPPLLLSLATLVFSLIAMSRFISRRAQFKAVLHSSNSAFDRGRFLRLLALTSVEAIWGFPVTLTLAVISIVGMHESGADLLEPYSWSRVHHNFYKVGRYPSQIWDPFPKQYATWELGHWVIPVSGLIFFALFGFTKECRAAYFPRSLFTRGHSANISLSTQLGGISPRAFDSFSHGKGVDVLHGLHITGKSIDDSRTEESLQIHIH
ncbi:fungal pheromone STE3G-protein-coupled receptor [Tilletiaria anomala UBC 951]|uniref:Fungal pheromone STE3G-protein-coupled receptor n=1 Tax=Tilletiaria anomala (strain ATCC 24038 / CBS 436.72 / UBC 951) TaxID=1037660 RepID=A0A066V655_TILAU|nr:fungal pheromone STE3G-protein-coupled receptor [Tilletiaria anomala UBC 951]KDN37232.1 fungal pheromone STE3G-protein-coupled receptor [Tilletiaria anomala UBC 951]